MSDEHSVSISLLGGFRVVAGHDTVIDQGWGHRKAASLIKLLALQPSRSLHREQVFETLWPQLAPADAANNLRKNLYYVRKAFVDGGGASPVALRGAMVSLPLEARLDIEEFRQQAQTAINRNEAASYRRALDLYTGDLLPADLYEEWTEPYRQELRSSRDDLLCRLAQALQQEGRLNDAIHCLRELLSADPLREDVHRSLMRLYARSGRRERALLQFEECRDLLQRVLGIEPSDETNSVRTELLEGEAPAGSPGVSTVNGSESDVRTAERAEPIPGKRPDIQHCTTKDGVSLAYYVMGAGGPLVIPSIILWSHLRMRTIPEYHRDGAGIGRFNRIVRYDCRGTGLSDRSILDYSLRATVADLETVVDHLGLECFDLIGHLHGSFAAITYAAWHPDRVSHLVLWRPFVYGPDWLRWSDKFASFRAMDEDWQGFTLFVANSNTEFADSVLARKIAAIYAEAMTPDGIRAFRKAMETTDVRGLLPGVKVPTLILCATGAPNVMGTAPHDLATIASKIPSAHLIEVEWDPSSATGWGQETSRIVEEFLGVGEG